MVLYHAPMKGQPEVTPHCVHVLISGRVQGVCFRMATCEEAERRGLKGWVKNLSTGQVEALFEGPESEVLAMLNWCHQGPPGAVVKEVQVTIEPCQGAYQDFRITR